MEKRRTPPKPQPLELDLDFGDEPTTSERETVMPEFDVEAYAKQQMVSPGSEIRIVAPYDVSLSMPAKPLPQPKNAQVLEDMRAYLDEKDFSGAMVLAESLLEEDRNNAEAKECVQRCRAALQEVYLRRLGSLSQVPVQALSRTELREAALDHRSGFLLSLMDGVSNLEMIHDVSGMPLLEVLQVVLSLLQQGVITLS